MNSDSLVACYFISPLNKEKRNKAGSYFLQLHYFSCCKYRFWNYKDA